MGTRDRAVKAGLAADLVTRDFLRKPFGNIRFWKAAIVRPNDIDYQVESASAEGDRLDLVLSVGGTPGWTGILEVHGPEDVVVTSKGLYMGKARRLRFQEAEAWVEGGKHWIRTIAGEGVVDVGDAKALSLD